MRSIESTCHKWSFEKQIQTTEIQTKARRSDTYKFDWRWLFYTNADGFRQKPVCKCFQLPATISKKNYIHHKSVESINFRSMPKITTIKYSGSMYHERSKPHRNYKSLQWARWCAWNRCTDRVYDARKSGWVIGSKAIVENASRQRWFATICNRRMSLHFELRFKFPEMLCKIRRTPYTLSTWIRIFKLNNPNAPNSVMNDFNSNLIDMANFCFTTNCRRSPLLTYLDDSSQICGENMAKCDHCDNHNVTNEYIEVDCTITASNLIEYVNETCSRRDYTCAYKRIVKILSLPIREKNSNESRLVL